MAERPRLQVICPRADVAQLVERRLPKPKVAGSRPVVRFVDKASKSGLYGLLVGLPADPGNVAGQRSVGRSGAYASQARIRSLITPVPSTGS